MKHAHSILKGILLVAIVCISAGARGGEVPSADVSAGLVGWKTDGPAVFRLLNQSVQSLPGPPTAFYPPPTNLPPELRRGMVRFKIAANVTLQTNAMPIFDHYLPESLNNLVWTNFIAHTNGKSMAMWSVRTHPPGWPDRPPQVQWNPNSLVFGMKGFTALSPCWNYEGPPGQTPVTALTRRHGYARGHLMRPDGFGATYAGRKVWFVTAQNTLVEARVAAEVVRTEETSRRDYTILIFDADLPPSIEPMRVARKTDAFGFPHTKYASFFGAPNILFQTEQGGNVSAGVPGFKLDVVKGGDSGSPDMVPMPGELVFIGGRTTSAASAEMQTDMDVLSQYKKLDPKKYQLNWVDWSAYPTY